MYFALLEHQIPLSPPFLKGDLAGFLGEVMRDTIKCKGLFLILPFDNVVAQFIGQLCLMNQATTKPFLKGDLAGFLSEVMRDTL